MISGVYDSMHLMHKEIKSAEAENGKEFSAFLNNSISQNESALSVPDKWITDGGMGNSAVDEVLKYLDIHGEALEQRKPTHDITDEQIEWLKSRHDIRTLHNKKDNSSEMQNFYADLVYLNVFSPNDTKTAVTKYPAVIPGHIRAWAENPIESPYTEDFGWSDCNSLADMAMYSVKVQARFLDAIKDKANDPNSYDPRDEDAIADMEELLKNKTECCEVLEKIFGQI